MLPSSSATGSRIGGLVFWQRNDSEGVSCCVTFSPGLLRMSAWPGGRRLMFFEATFSTKKNVSDVLGA